MFMCLFDYTDKERQGGRSPTPSKVRSPDKKHRENSQSSIAQACGAALPVRNVDAHAGCGLVLSRVGQVSVCSSWVPL